MLPRHCIRQDDKFHPARRAIFFRIPLTDYPRKIPDASFTSFRQELATYPANLSPRIYPLHPEFGNRISLRPCRPSWSAENCEVPGSAISTSTGKENFYVSISENKLARPACDRCTAQIKQAGTTFRMANVPRWTNRKSNDRTNPYRG